MTLRSSVIPGVQSVDEAAVLHAFGPAGRADTRNPEGAEFALLVAAIPVGIVARLHELFVGGLEQTAFATPVAFGGLQNFFVTLVRHHSTFHARHIENILSYTVNTRLSAVKREADRERDSGVKLVEAFAQHPLDPLQIALEQLPIVVEVAFAIGVFLAHQVVEAGLAAHQFARGGLSEPLDDGLAGFDLVFCDLQVSIPVALCGRFSSLE
jgi:hypothetical protein